VSRPLKFAVVREDPRVEAALVERFGVRSALLCASGGCTAFALAEQFPPLELSLYDFNPTQLAHVEARADAIAEGRLAELNVDSASTDGLSQRGDFEKLFRLLRQAVLEFVAPEAELERFFAPSTPLADAHALARAWVRSPYWPAVFALAFTDELLVAMFGPDAVQHAERGSYPGYFARVFERGLLRDDGPRNPFLQHVFLSRYLPVDAPSFLSARRRFRFESHLGGVPDVPRLERFGLVHLSNIFDWADEALAARWTEALRALKPGAVVSLRQLNNQRDWRPLFGSGFRFEDALGAELLAADRSLFYERLTVAVRT
jgi:S-adenosylmethionine-diacylglycerol 3-amino-3-carboxypropyl transferase